MQNRFYSVLLGEDNMLKDYVKFRDIDVSRIEQYKGRLPEELFDFWREFGLGTFYNGYLKATDPNEYIELVQQSYFDGEVTIPIFATAFGDIITWEDNKYIGILKYRYQDSDIISTGFEDFFEEVEEGVLDDDYFTIKKYNAAVKKYGELEYDECFGYVPLLALGGKESVKSLKKVKMREHIALIAELTDGI